MCALLTAAMYAEYRRMQNRMMNIGGGAEVSALPELPSPSLSEVRQLGCTQLPGTKGPRLPALLMGGRHTPGQCRGRTACKEHRGGCLWLQAD